MEQVFYVFASVCMVFTVAMVAWGLFGLLTNVHYATEYAALQEEVFSAARHLEEIHEAGNLRTSMIGYALSKVARRRYIDWANIEFFDGHEA
jgi:hypothetical protein